MESNDAPSIAFYRAVQEYLDKQNITIYTPNTLRDAVIAIRTDKLPDPRERLKQRLIL